MLHNTARRSVAGAAGLRTGFGFRIAGGAGSATATPLSLSISHSSSARRCSRGSASMAFRIPGSSVSFMRQTKKAP